MGRRYGTRYLGSGAEPLGHVLGSSLGGAVGSLLPRENEDEAVAYLAESATSAESDEDADAFIGALVPLAISALPSVARVAGRVIPHLARSAARTVRVLRSRPSTRRMVRAMPTIVRRTAMDIGRQARRGRPVTPAAARRVLARNTARVLRNPRSAARAMRYCRSLARRYPVRRRLRAA